MGEREERAGERERALINGAHVRRERQKVEEERTSERTELYFVFYCFSSSLLFISGTGYFVVKEQGAEREREREKRESWREREREEAAILGGEWLGATFSSQLQ